MTSRSDQQHKLLGIVLSYNKIFVQWVNKMIIPCVLKISTMVPTLDYRIVGSRSYFNIMDPATFKNLSKISKSDSLKTLDWDVVIIPRNACGCLSSIKDPEKKDYDALMTKICTELDTSFNHRKNELNWILEDYKLKVNKIAYTVDKYNTYRFSLQIICGETVHNISILDVFNGSADKVLVSNPKLYFQDCYGFKYIGLVDILKNIFRSLQTTKTQESFDTLYSRLQFVLNTASIGLLSKSYYTKVQMYINKGNDSTKSYNNYINDISKVLNDIINNDNIKQKITNKKDNFKLINTINIDSVTLRCIEGESILSNVTSLLESIKRTHDHGLKIANDQKEKTKQLIDSILATCCNSCESVQKGGNNSDSDTEMNYFNKKLSTLDLESIS